jgi:RNase P/RNase MRP subunit POP5
VLAVPAAASAHASRASVNSNVHSAQVALRALAHAGAKHPAIAKRALAHNKASMARGANAVRSLAATGNVSATASALGTLAKQYDRDVRMYVSMIPTTSGSLQTQLASSLQPALTGRSVADWLLGQLTSSLPSGGTSSATGTLSGLLGNLPSLIQSLTGVVGSGDVSSQVQGIVAQALTTATGVLDASLAQVQALLPSLPVADQATVQGVITQIQSIVGTIESTLGNVAQTITGSLGGTDAGSTIGSQLTQVLGVLQGILGGLGNGAGAGSTGTGSTGVCSSGLASLLGNLPLPSFISGLLQNTGLGDCASSGTGSASGSGLSGLFGGGLPFGL